MNKNLMNMDGMKRAAKMLMKGGSDLGAVIIDQKCMQEVISGKLIPSINNVATALLKWSYTESNYTLPDVFSACADLDAGFTQLLQEYLEESSRYRKSFKDIITEAKKLSDIQKEKEKTASKVAATNTRLENARKTAKKHENKEKAKTIVSNLEADLHMAKAKDEETEELLRNKLDDFEFYKSSMLKDSLTTHCRALKSLLQKGTDLCQTKLEIAESMPEEPAMTPDVLSDNNRKVEDIFNKFQLQLPPRDPTVERNLPVQRFKTLPLPQMHYQPKSPKIIKQASVLVHEQHKYLSKPVGGIAGFNPSSDTDAEDKEDYDDDYMVPNEEMIPMSPVKETPPELPPRNVIEEDEYVIPTLSPQSPSGRQVPPNPETQADYFEVITDDEAPVRPTSNTRKPPPSPRLPPESPVPIDEPVYTAPPEDIGDDYNQLYSNMTNEELKEHQRTSVSIPARPVPYGKPRKPVVYPKPFQKATEGMSSRSRQDSSSQDEQVAAEDDDIYSMVCEDESNPPKTGGSPPTPVQRHTFLDTEHFVHDRLSDSSETETMHTYMSHSRASLSTEMPSQESQEWISKVDSSEIDHTYYCTRMEDKQMSGTDQNIYGNIPDTYLAETEKKPSPIIAKMPPTLTKKKKPVIAVRGRVK